MSTVANAKSLAEIRQGSHAAVRKNLHGPIAVAKHDGAQLDLLHRAGDAIDPCGVSHAHLIFEDEEKPRDDVSHQILAAEPDREPAIPAPVRIGMTLIVSSCSSITTAEKTTNAEKTLATRLPSVAARR